MYGEGFLSEEDRDYLRRYMGRRKADGLCVRRANALLALDKGRSQEDVCDFLEIGRTTLHGWLSAHKKKGLSFLEMTDYSAREGHLSRLQEKSLRYTLRETPMRTTNEIRDHIRKTYGHDYSRSGCIKLLHRLGFGYKKPEQLPAQADEQEQRDFIENYEKLQRSLPEDEAIYFADAVHPDHQVRPAHGWFHEDDRPAVSANSGRKRVNIHGALCLENFDAPFVEVETVNADSTIELLKRIEARNKDKKIIHVIWDNAPYHKSEKVREWLSRPCCRIHLIRMPSYAPHLNPIERLWGVMHKYVTHNKFYKTYKDFAKAILGFLRQTIPKEWKTFRDTVTDNFRVISTTDRKIIT
jgi:transposase